MVSVNKVQNNQKSISSRYANIKWSGYISTGSLALCCLSGIRKIKLPYKHSLHKISGVLALVSTIWHLGAIKQWDKIFDKF